MNVLERVVVVLVRSEGPLNVGSVARLCGNFGCGLRLVQPLTDVTQRDAVKMAHPAEALLAQATVFPTLDEALADVALAVGTSSKIADALAAPSLSVSRARVLLPAEHERLALVFGNERTGLSVDEAARCARVFRLPTPGPFESLNLSHAVAVSLALFSAAAEGTETEFAFRASPASRAALQKSMTVHLEARGFFKGGDRAREGFQPRLQELLDKMDLSERDLELLQDLLLVLGGRSS